MIRKHSRELNNVLQDNAMLTRMMMQTQEVETDCREWDAVAKTHQSRKKIAAIAIMIVAALMLLLPILCHAAGERELVTVLAAKVRHGIIQRGAIPDSPPNIRLNNLENPGRTGTADRTEVKSLDTIAKAVSAVPDLVRELSLKTHDLAVALAEEAEADRENRRLKQELEESRAKVAALQEEHEPPPSAAEVVGATPLVPVPEVPSLQIFAPVGAAGTQEEVYWLTVLSQESCPPCKTLWADVGEVYRTGSTTVHFEWIDVVKEPQRIPAAYRNWSFTTPLVTFQSETGPRFISWPTNKAHILSMLRKWKAIRAIPVAATGTAGALTGVRGRIEQSLAWFGAHVNGPLEIVWDSNRNNGTGTSDGFALFNAKASDWVSDRLYGTMGSFVIRCPGGIKIGDQLFEYLEITYKSDGNKLQVMTSFAIEKGLVAPGDRIATKAVGVVGAGEPTKFVDPATALTIFSVLRGLWDLCHPECDLQLPGRIKATTSIKDNAFLVKFDGSPKLRIKVLWEWLLGIDWVTVSPTKAHLEFLRQGYWFEIHSREFPINN